MCALSGRRWPSMYCIIVKPGGGVQDPCVPLPSAQYSLGNSTALHHYGTSQTTHRCLCCYHSGTSKSLTTYNQHAPGSTVFRVLRLKSRQSYIVHVQALTQTARHSNMLFHNHAFFPRGYSLAKQQPLLNVDGHIRPHHLRQRYIVMASH
jgi:hypothetical protein